MRVTIQLSEIYKLVQLIIYENIFRLHLQNSNPETLKFKCLLENYELCRIGKSCWINGVKDLNYAGLQEIWSNVGDIAHHTQIKATFVQYL